VMSYARPGEGRFTQPKAATQAGRRELVFMPLSRPSKQGKQATASGQYRSMSGAA